MSNLTEENQSTSSSILRRKRRNFNYVESVSQHLNDSVTVSEEYVAESLRKINAILSEIVKVQEGIASFNGLSEESLEYLDMENILFDGLIELDRIHGGNSDELNQKKKEAIFIIQGQLRKLDKKLQDNLSKVHGEEKDSLLKNEQTKEDKAQNTNETAFISSSDTSSLETIEETEEISTTENISSSKMSQEQLNRGLADIRINRSIDNNIDRSNRIEKYLQEIGQKFQTYREASNFILENSRNQVRTENPYREYQKKVMSDCSTPLRIKTSSAREFISSDRIMQDYRRNTSTSDKKSTRETVAKEALSENIFSGLFKIFRECGNNLLSIFLPTVEMGNRLALKRIQVVLLQIRLLLIILILEIPLLTALVFFGLFLYMPDVVHYHV
ncbi:hypothetical protein ILUMI_00123 [Ignelater luminosus]|uniref:BAG domain-containing protein n=1 Tax=Ignelater luminosus TaxID=2038154 RepID=A0A8K0GIQ6_IGNLU|nr:hypothetical protein ILUMI_00123 [Ignelater luminosus]